MKLDSPFRFAVAAVDAVIFGMFNNELQVLIKSVSTDGGHYQNLFGFPGGVMQPDENASEALRRHLAEKVSLTKIYTEQLYTFTDVDRDVRSRAVAIAYLGLVPPDVAAEYEHESAKFVPVTSITTLAYDHLAMLAVARTRLASKLLYTTIARELLPATFTLTELQSVYEIVRGETFDKRNFRKKILALDIIVDSGAVKTGVANRPAVLYSFKGTQVIEVPQIAGM
jgi:8-oxo-dGTP diphosphatase